jgi:UDP-N-acetylmuramate dehydrogenase
VTAVDAGAALRAAAGEGSVRADAPLAAMTTFKVGGCADWLVEVSGTRAALAVIAAARRLALRVTVLGGGSNVLVADSGVRGVVIRVHGGEIAFVAPSSVRADAGVTINGLVRWTIGRGYAGLEAWAGTPGTVGGAIYGNAHFRGRNIGELVTAVDVVTASGDVERINRGDMEFGYDASRVQRTHEIVLAAEFAVTRGEPAALRTVARESLAFRKRTQPLDAWSAGCIFQNPDPRRDPVPDGIPASAGALVDRAGLKGASEGGARVSERHGNFIINDGSATAEDIRRLIERCRRSVHDRFGVLLRDEIVCLGFDARAGGRSHH